MIWVWYGWTPFSTNEDWKFGIYLSESASMDQFTYTQPEYLAVFSAGNDRTNAPTTQPTTHLVQDPVSGLFVTNTTTVRNSDGDQGGYDTMNSWGSAKNVLTVGAVNDLVGGYTNAAGVTLASFSSFGPTDDGRIKPDVVANGVGVKYTYISLLDLASNTKSWVRLSDMDFGSAGPKGLRWLTMLACNVLRPANITSMINHSKLPINDNLHLLMGCETTAYAGARIGQYYSSNLVADVTIPNAWYAAASKSYQENHGGITNTVTFRTLGWQPCFSDKLSLYNDPDTSQGIFSQSQNVYVLP